MVLALLTAVCFQTGETLHVSVIYYLRKFMSRKLNRSALSASQVTAGLHCLFAVSPRDDHVKPVGCRDGNNKSSFTTAPGWERQSRTHQCYKQGWAAACGSKTGELWAASLGCTYYQNPGTWWLWSHFALSPLPRTISRVSSRLNFAYSTEKFGAAVIYIPNYWTSTDKHKSLITVIYPQHTTEENRSNYSPSSVWAVAQFPGA